MNKYDWMDVGCRMLGLYFLASGVVSVWQSFLAAIVTLTNRGGIFVAGIGVAQSIVYIIVGAALLFGAGLILPIIGVKPEPK